MGGAEERRLLPCFIFCKEHFSLLFAQGIPHECCGVGEACGDKRKGLQWMPYQNHALVGSTISKGASQVVQLELPPEFWRIGIRVLLGVKPGIGNRLPA